MQDLVFKGRKTLKNMVRVILAEDEPIVRRGLVNSIDWESNGIELVGAVENGMDAYMMALELTPEIIITDIRMPVMDGLQLVKKLKEEMPSIHFIIISAYQEFSYAKQAMHYGVEDYIVKPLDEQELLDNILNIHKKISDSRRLFFQRNIDCLLLKSDQTFVCAYMEMENKLREQFIQRNDKELKETLCQIYELFDTEDNRQYYRSVCVRQMVMFQRVFDTFHKEELFEGIEEVIEDELMRLDNNLSIFNWYLQKMEELTNMLNIKSRPRIKRIVEEAEAYLQENYMNDITLKEVAARLYVSPQYLSRIFHEEQKKSFVEWLNTYRVEKAKQLLRENEEAISQIAEKVGYRDYKYFSNVFKKYTGLTPRDYRKKSL